MSMTEIKSLVEPLLTMINGAPPPPAKVNEFAEIFISRLMEQQGNYLKKHDDILFVIAAGNTAENNDRVLTSPPGIQLDNVIVVGATVGNVASVPFSNYGAYHVDLFAPGVGINSAVPRDLYLPYSGTEMAAAEVSRIAAMIRDKNPKLKAKDVKELLMGTIDRKDFLKAKAYTEGVVNDQRALFAAENSLTLDVRKAVQSAKSAVADKAPAGKTLDESSDRKLITPL